MSKKNAKKEGLGDVYWRKLLLEGKRPATVFAFCEEVGIGEGDFYEEYSGFEGIEAGYWKGTVEETIGVLEKDKDFGTFSGEEKLLSFFYTWFEHVKGDRSRVVHFFPKSGACGMKVLRPMREVFLGFAEELVRESVESGEIADRKKFNQYYGRALFEHFRMLVEFYRKDTSEGFQDTDAFIEKSTKVAIETARNGVLDSAVDLGRFLLRKISLGK